MSNIRPAQISAQIAKGEFRPHTMMTNMALNYYQSFDNYFARAIFPTVRVRLSSDNYVRWSLEDLLRNNWQLKPAYGKVTPTVIGEDSDTYSVKVYQDIRGIDEIRETDISRRQGNIIRKRLAVDRAGSRRRADIRRRQNHVRVEQLPVDLPRNGNRPDEFRRDRIRDIRRHLFNRIF